MQKIFIVIAFLSAINSLAQSRTKLKITETPIYSDNIKSDSLNAIYSSQSNRSVVVRTSKNAIILDLFNSELKITDTKSINLEKKEFYLGDLFFNDQLRIFTQVNPKRDLKILNCYVLNLRNDTIKKIVLSETEVDKGLSLMSNERASFFTISPDESAFAIVNATVYRSNLHYHVSVFNLSDSQIIYDKQVSVSENNFVDLIQADINNNKSVYILRKSYFNNDSPELKEEENSHLLLDKIAEDDISLIKVTVEEKHLKAGKGSLIDQTYRVIGFYSNSGEDVFNGVFECKIDLSNFVILNSRIDPFPQSVYADIFGNKRSNKKTGEDLLNYRVRSLLTDDDENLYLIAEEYINLREGYNKREIFGDLLIVKFDSQSNFLWVRNILRHDVKPAFNSFVKNNKLHILLNSGKDLGSFRDGRPFVKRKAFQSTSLYDIEFENDGVFSVLKIQDNKNKSYYKPNFGVFINDRFIMLSTSENERRFMVLE